MKFRELKLRRDPACPICGDHPTIKELIDYDQFCGIPGEIVTGQSHGASQPAPAEAAEPEVRSIPMKSWCRTLRKLSIIRTTTLSQ